LTFGAIKGLLQMKYECLTVIFLLSISPRVIALDLKIGANLTHIEVSNCREQVGLSFGISREWHIWQTFFLEGEALFTSKRAILASKRINFYPGCIYTYDIHCSYGFIELPILLKFYVPLRDDLRLQVHAGPSLDFGVYDHSSKEERLDGYSVSPVEYDESKSYDYDYGEIYDPGLLWPYRMLNSPFGLNLGVGVNFSVYGFEIRYHRSNIGTARTFGSLIDLKENYYTIQCLLIAKF